ncbi:MAG: glycosyltransferase family 2 protein [Verrucomicrobiota bacterium]
MLRQRKIIVVMPAYNAAKTLVRTHTEVSALGIVDQVIVVDDASHDETLEIAGTLENTLLYLHPKNLGYGANQKSCYRLALEHGADIAIMVHPDYQYTPRLIPAMAELIASGLYDAVLASRILGGGALRGGMPMWRYVSNRLLTFIENLLTGAKLSEYHTGYRAFSREVLETLTLDSNSNDFVFDNQVIAQMLWSDFRIAEVTCPTRYFKEASSISLARCIRYGLGCIGVGLAYRLAKIGVPVCGKLFPAKTASSERSTPLESGPLD